MHATIIILATSATKNNNKHIISSIHMENVKIGKATKPEMHAREFVTPK